MNKDSKKIKELLEIIEKQKLEIEHLKSKVPTQQKINDKKSKNKKKKEQGQDEEQQKRAGDDKMKVEPLTEKQEQEDQDEMTMDIDLKEIEIKQYKQVSNIAKSLNLQGTGKKTEILERIKQLIESKKLERSKRNNSSNNNNNKQPMELTEILFWKVFRNKWLKRQLFNQVCSNKYALKYDELYNVQFLISHNQVELLKYKVNRGDYLTGFEVDSSFSKLYRFIKSDQQFYNNLFTNYQKTTLFNPKVRAMNAVSVKCIGVLQSLINKFDYKPTIESIKEALRTNCSKTFDLLYKNYQANDQITENEIYKEIFNSNGESIRKRTKVINHLIQSLELSPPKMSVTRICKLYSQCPINELYSLNDLINACRSIILLKLNKSKLLKEKEKLEKEKKEKEEKEEQEEPKTTTTTESKELKDQPMIENVFLTIDEINEISTTLSNRNNFIDKSLKQKVEDFISEQSNDQDSTNFKMVLNLLKMYYFVRGGKDYLTYSLLIKEQDTQVLKENVQANLSSKINYPKIFINSIRFANVTPMKILKTTNYGISSMLADISNNNINLHLYPKSQQSNNRTVLNYLFQFEKNKQVQMKFIKEFCQLVITKEIEISVGNMLLNLLIAFGDVELLETAYNLLGKPKLSIEQQFSTISIISVSSESFYVNSVEILEFIFNNCLKQKEKPISIFHFVYQGRIDLVRKYVSLLETVLDKTKMAKLIFNLETPNTSIYSTRSLKAIVELVTDPILSQHIGTNTINKSHIKNGINFKSVYTIWDFVKIIEKYPEITHYFSCESSFDHTAKTTRYTQNYFAIVFSRWVFYNHYLNQGLKRFTFERSIANSLFYTESVSSISNSSVSQSTPPKLKFTEIVSICDGYDDFINNYLKVNFKKSTVVDDTGIDNDGSTTTTVVTPSNGKIPVPAFRPKKRYSSSSTSNEDHGLLKILSSQTTLGNIKIFEVIIDNGFSFLFQTKKGNQNAIFNKFNLRDLLFTALANDHLELALLLIDKCNIQISELQFNSNVKKRSSTFCYLFDRYSTNEKINI